MFFKNLSGLKYFTTFRLCRNVVKYLKAERFLTDTIRSIVENPIFPKRKPLRVFYYLVEERCTGKNHGEFTCVIGIILPTGVTSVPSVEPGREPNNSLPVLPPNTESKRDLIMTELDIVIHTQHSFCLNHVEGEETVVQTVNARFVQLIKRKLKNCSTKFFKTFSYMDWHVDFR